MTKRILVVEDTEDNRQIIRDLMTSAGYELIEAVDGIEGVAAAEREKPDLILMDIQLPGIDGYEATRRIRMLPELAKVPIIAVTSYAQLLSYLKLGGFKLGYLLNFHVAHMRDGIVRMVNGL